MTEKSEWKAFIDDKPARDAAEARWLALHDKLAEAERLALDERWSTDDPWPGVIYRPGKGETRFIDVETWAFMRALMRGIGEALIRLDRAA